MLWKSPYNCSHAYVEHIENGGKFLTDKLDQLISMFADGYQGRTIFSAYSDDQLTTWFSPADFIAALQKENLQLNPALITGHIAHAPDALYFHFQTNETGEVVISEVVLATAGIQISNDKIERIRDRTPFDCDRASIFTLETEQYSCEKNVEVIRTISNSSDTDLHVINNPFISQQTQNSELLSSHPGLKQPDSLIAYSPAHRDLKDNRIENISVRKPTTQGVLTGYPAIHIGIELK